MSLLLPALHALSLTLSQNLLTALLAGLWRATWQGALLIAGVYAICRIGRRLPAWLRCSLWWVASLKMVISLCCLATIPLAVLPSAHIARTLARPLPIHARLVFSGTNLTIRKAATVKPAAVPIASANETAASSPALAATQPPQRLSIPLWYLPLAFWGLGVILIAFLALRGLVSTARLIRHASPAVEGDLALARSVAERLGLRRMPRIVGSDEADGVFVTGMVRPTIVLPNVQWSELSEKEARMVLAHEMAHLRRADLWFGLVPTAARHLFFFHPLVWVAAREYSLCREEACDLLALRATGLSVADYGHLLVKMATRAPSPRLAHALGMSPAYHAIRRRLETIAIHARIAERLRLRSRFALALTLPLLCAFLLPWRLVAAHHANITASNSAPSFILSDMGAGGPGQIGAVAMNDQGQVVATSETQDGNVSYAFVLASANSQSLGSLPRYAYCRASAVNNTGAVAASSYNLYDHNHAFIWRAGEKTRLIGLPSFHFSKALAINDSDQVAGYVENGGYYHGERKAKAALWDGSTNEAHALDLGTLGGRYSAALAINNQGQVAGKADTAIPHVTHACLWQDGTPTDLGALPGGTNSVASAINDHGVVVGDSETADAPHAFVWNAALDGQMRDLSTLPGGLSSHASAINNAGEIVGQSVVAAKDGEQAHAVVWLNGHIYDLNKLVNAPGWVLEGACAITNSGQIAGVGFYHGKQRVFVLTPLVPLAQTAVSRV
jgi:probable HAF family extracellular repeat protein